MEVGEILDDKEIKGKAKVEAIAKLILEGETGIADVIKAAGASKDPNKANCIEAIELATKDEPGLASVECLKFVTEALLDKTPRIKWESAKVVGNIAHLYPAKLDQAIGNLLNNSEFPGTVVRWSAAFALGEIVKLKSKRNKELIPAIEAIVEREQNNGVRKMYLAALKAVAKKA
jgi:hypothetical protein